MKKIYTSVGQIDFNLNEIPDMPVPQRVLMVDPAYYDVRYVINPHMTDRIGTVNSSKARKEWKHLKEGFKKLDLEVIILEGQPNLPDMVFCANQSLPYCDNNGNKKVIMGIMHAEQRKGEVPFIEKWFRENNYEVLYPDEKKVADFEGMGDAIWHFNRELLWGGYGFRSSVQAYEEISHMLDVPVILLELQDERFYHLDTCLCPLNTNSVLIYPSAFSKQGLDLIYAMYDNVIEAGSHEAEKLFAVNATVPDGKNVLIQEGCTDVNNKLRALGFHVHEFSTYEFLKSGGSVFCMKLLIW